MAILDEKHADYPWPFSLIPRSWTAFKWGPPVLVKGANILPRDLVYVSYAMRISPKPITSPGSWQLSHFPDGPWFAWYFAISGFRKPDGFFRHFRIGARWDSVDNYVQFPSLATRRYTGDDTQRTNVD